jgi:hypothetical protein
MDVRSGMRATLLAVTFIWMGASLPHMYSSTRAFFLESLPSILSAAMAPRCLFVFSNIIVAVLVGESKLSRRRGAPCNTTDNVVAPSTTGNGVIIPERKEQGQGQEVMAVAEALLPTFTGDSIHEHENSRVMVTREDMGSSGLNQAQKIDQFEEGVDRLYLHEVYEVQGAGEGEGDAEEEQECTAMQALQETDLLLPADELNRRVEDFIARFNMERQLEAKMLVCCY